MTLASPAWIRALETTPAAWSGKVDVEGELASVRGSYYLNGPARFSRAGQRYRHWLDGDGMVLAVHFADREVTAVLRQVESAKFREEEQAGRALFRTFGTSFAGDRLRAGIALESPVNVSVFAHAGRLLVFGEQSLPYELDPRTLETRGPFDFDHKLNAASPFSAHAKIDPSSGELFNFGVSYAKAAPTLHLYRFDAEGRRVYRSRVALDAAHTIHDFAVAPQHLIFHLSPYTLDVDALLGQGATQMDALRWDPDGGSALLVADRETGAHCATIPLPGPAHFSLHTVGAMADADRLTVCVQESARPDYEQYQPVPELFQTVVPTRIARYVIDTTNWTLIEAVRDDHPLAADFPARPPAASATDTHWTLAISNTGQDGPKFFDRLERIEWRDGRGDVVDHYRAPSGCVLGGEPVFVGERNLIVQETSPDGRPRSLVVLDPMNLAHGPHARLHLPGPTHLGFHAVFVPAE